METKKREGFVGQRMVVAPGLIKQRVSKNELSEGLYITDIGYFPRAIHHYRNRKNGSAEYILIYCTEGEGYISVLGKGNLVCLDPLILGQNANFNLEELGCLT